MNYSSLAILCGVMLLLCLVVPASCTVSPLWIEYGMKSGELSGVVISADESTIIAGGDQVISLTPEGRKRWAGWSGSSLAISSDGDYILASKDQTVRLISGAGTVIWEKGMGITITDLSMTPDASLIAAAGGGRVKLMDFSGEDIASNSTLAVNHIRIMPDGDRILITTNNNVQLTDLNLLPEWSDTNSTQNLIALAPDGSTFVTAVANRVRLYSGTGKLIWDKKFSGGNAQALAYSRDGSVIVIGMDDNSLQVLNHFGSSLWSANASNWITCVAVSDDGNTIAAGSMDKKLSVYNRAGTRLGTFTAHSAIKFNSIAMTGNGSLIVLVDESAVYAFSRASFTGETPDETIYMPSPGTTVVTIPVSLPVTTTRTVPPRIPALPTPYPLPSETPQTPLPLGVPLAALLVLFLCRSGKT